MLRYDTEILIYSEPLNSELLISGFVYFLFLQVVCFAVSKRPVAVYEADDKDVRHLHYWCFRRKGKLRYVFDKDILLLSIVCAIIWVFFIDSQMVIALFKDIIPSAHATYITPPLDAEFSSYPKRLTMFPRVLLRIFSMMPILWGALYWLNITKSDFKKCYTFFSVFLLILILFFNIDKSALLN
jgi:hypothetical protein